MSYTTRHYLEDELELFVLGRMTKYSAEAVARHCWQCQRCMNLTLDLEDVASDLKTVLENDYTLVPPMTSVTSVHSVGPIRSTHATRQLYPAMAAAAALVVSVSGGVLHIRTLERSVPDPLPTTIAHQVSPPYSSPMFMPVVHIGEQQDEVEVSHTRRFRRLRKPALPPVQVFQPPIEPAPEQVEVASLELPKLQMEVTDEAAVEATIIPVNLEEPQLPPYPAAKKNRFLRILTALATPFRPSGM